MKVSLPALARATCTSAVSVSSSFQEGFVDRYPGGPRAVEELVSGGVVNGDVRDALAVLLADHRKRPIIECGPRIGPPTIWDRACGRRARSWRLRPLMGQVRESCPMQGENVPRAEHW
jgi:hypothetical protein